MFTKFTESSVNPHTFAEMEPDPRA